MTRSLDEIRKALASRYRVERELGSGASATVYLAHDLARGFDVAIKVLNPELVQATGGERFLREIEVAASLQHPNLVAILDSGELGGEVFYVTPHIAGGSLRDLLKRERQLYIRDAVHFTREIASALAYIHAHGIVHRDVKPENILLEGPHACLADFGIARALDRAAGDTITSTGLVVGTPTYMSPEQGSGERAVDARSDQYSLACVAYEMIAGVPPFIGATAQAVIAQRFAHDALPLSHYRKSVAPHIESAIARALELNPADRYPSVERLAASLADASLTSTAETWGARTSRAVQRRWFTIGAATAIVLLAVLGFWQGYPRVQAAFSTAPDTTRFVVLPFDATSAPGWSGARIADAAYVALRGWEDLPIVGDVAVRDEVGAQRTSITSLAEASGTAAVLGAGRLIWGRAVPSANGITITADLYDVRTRRSLRNASAQLAAGEALGEKMSALTDELLRLPELRRAPEGDLGTRSFTARREFERGEFAYAAGDFTVAMQHYSRAAAADREFARADLRIALVGMLTGISVDEWQQQARRAAAARASFSPRGSAFAAALAAVADRRYPEACNSFDAARRVDSLDFAAWYGLGECRYMDSAVVSAPASRSHFAFRASHHTAAASYLRAAELDARAYALPLYDRLSRLLKTETSRTRRGYAATGDVYMAFPEQAGDTIAFVPHLFAGRIPEGAYPAPVRHAQAVDRGVRTLLAFARGWRERDSGSPASLMALGDLLELSGAISESSDPAVSALAAVRQARRLERDPVRSTILASQEARLLVKRGEFAAAQRLVDSLLARSPAVSETASQLAALAALTGRVTLATQLWRAASSVSVNATGLAPQILASAAVLEAYAAIGICGRLEEARAALLRSVDAYATGADAEAIKLRLLEIPARLAAPCVEIRSPLWIMPADPLARAQRLHAIGQPRAALRILDSLETGVRRYRRPGDVSLDWTYQEVWLRAAAGDTAGAIDRLDRILESLPAHRSSLLMRMPEGAALPRAMVLRADLAAKSGDVAGARRWAAAVLNFRRNADPELRAESARMRVLAGP